MTKKAPYTPTRTCPHRWCKPMHLAPVPFGLAIIAFDLWNNWRMIIGLFLFLFLAYWVQKAVHFKRRPRSGPVTVAHVVEDLRAAPSPIELEMEDAKYEGTGWRMLEVRPGWARIALLCDMVIVTAVGLGATLLFSNPSMRAQEAQDMRFDGEFLISMLGGAAFLGFSVYAHKKATQPRKPKRAWLPAFLRTQGS
jgi:hypothetical protein